MPDYVLDASAAAKTFRNEPHAGELRAFLTDAITRGARILAPPVFDVEIRNVAARTAREVGDPGRCYQHYLRAMELVELAAIETSSDFALAVEQAITVQDAQYLDVARRHGAALVSYDERQRAAGEACGVEVLAPGFGSAPTSTASAPRD